MSAAPRKKKPTPSHTLSPAWFLSDGSKRILVACALVVFAGIPFLLGKYFELKVPDPYDSGSYVYSAQHILSGARIGYDEKPSAQAGTLLVNMLGVTLPASTRRAPRSSRDSSRRQSPGGVPAG
jgi:hypothetical protein